MKKINMVVWFGLVWFGLQGFPRRDGKHYRSMVVMVMVMVLLCYLSLLCKVR